MKLLRLLPAATAAALSGVLLLAGCGTPPPAGVVLIVVDTLRADHLGCYGYERPTSPALDLRAREAALFERAFATSPWTLPTFGSLLTGEIPSRHAAGSRVDESGRALSRRLDESLPTLAERFGAAGRATAAFVNNPWLRPRFGLARGFDLWDHQPGDNRRHRRADEMVDLALSWIDDRGGEPFFLLLHLFDPHMTYDAPPPFRGLFTAGLGPFSLPVAAPRQLRQRAAETPEEERRFIAAAYDEEIAFVDSELERFFAALEERGLWRRLLVVLTADHGEELYDHGSFEHGHTLYQELLRVPLLIWGPGVEPGRREQPVSVADLAPTILEAAGLEAAGTAGRSLQALLAGGGQPSPPRSLIAEATLYGAERKAIVEWPLKLVADAAGRLELFDLAEDPGERTDLALARATEARRLAGRLRERIDAASAEAGGEEQPLDEATRRELRSLGYLP